MEPQKQVNERYLSVNLSIGGVDHRFKLFKNPAATLENKQPHYRSSDGYNFSVAVWLP